MKRIIPFMTFASLVLLQGCSLEEVGFDPQNPDDISQDGVHKVQIYGEINQQPASKVTTDGFCTDDEVGVFLVNYDGETPGVLKLEGNQADNVRFTYDESGDWVSEHDIYYKDNETNVDFYGYYPYADPTSVSAYPFEVAQDQSKGAENGQMSPYEASDFLWAKRENVSPTASKVMLSFHHMMSAARVRFSQGTGWKNASEYEAVAKDVLVTSTVRRSKINLASGKITPVGTAPLTGIVPLEDNGEYRAIVVPQTVAAGKDVLVITVDGYPRKYVRNVNTEYLPGKITTFDLTISRQEETGEYLIELTGVNISAWEADNVSHSDGAKEYVVVHNVEAGRLERTVVDRLEMDPAKIKNLKLTGEINEKDYSFMRDKMSSLQRLNLKEVESCYGSLPQEEGTDEAAEMGYVIPPEALDGKSTLVKCVLPDRLDRIEDNAFANTSLTGTLMLPEGLSYVDGFSGTKITNIHFPSTLEEIAGNAFDQCKSLMCELSLPESLKRIGYCAFYNSAIAGNLILPESLESIAGWAFASCHNLTGSLVIPSMITSIEDLAFHSCGFNGTLSLPEGLKEIGKWGFDGCSFKGELNLPDGMIKIGERAFYGNSFSGVLVLPSELVSLDSDAFESCERFSGVLEIPETIIALPSSVFRGCTGIEEVRLHKNVEMIGSGAFAECHGIKSIVCEAKNPPVISPDSFDGVAKDAFSVKVPEASVNRYKNADNWNMFRSFVPYRQFAVSHDMFRALNASCSKTVVVSAPSGENWSVESKPEWIEVSPSYGTGDTEVLVRMLSLEKGSSDRAGEVVFQLDGKEYHSTMTVEQYDYEYGDGDVVILQSASVGNGVNIVLMGDCFDAKDISEGRYLAALEEAYGYFFDIEPYLTYKDYFNVYGIFGMSPDSGIGTVNTVREARFGSLYTFNEGISLDFETAFAAACAAPVDDDVASTLIIMVENTPDYSGQSYIWGDGSAVAVVPMSSDPAPYDFRGNVHHEAGGHCFGKLADEYVNHNAFISQCSCDCCGHDEEVEAMQSYGFYENISLSGSMQDVPWSHLIEDPQYSNIVDVYEGAFYHSKGVFRSEPTSCMYSNIAYYNAISRESMVKRIKGYAGEEYSFEDFKLNDKETLPDVPSKGGSLLTEDNHASASAQYDQLPPRFMGGKPAFLKSDF